MGKSRSPVLIQRELLLQDQHSSDLARIEELVAFQRHGHPVLLVAKQPTSWRPTRRSVDHDLALQQELHQLIRRAGAELDGIVYLATGLFARRRNRLEELEQLAARYDRSAGDLILVASESKLLESIVQSGGRALAVGEVSVSGATRFETLRQALESLY
jgi:hypothetical protein